MFNSIGRKPAPYSTDRDDRVSFQAAHFGYLQLDFLSQCLIFFQQKSALVTFVVISWCLIFEDPRFLFAIAHYRNSISLTWTSILSGSSNPARCRLIHSSFPITARRTASSVICGLLDLTGGFFLTLPVLFSVGRLFGSFTP